MVNGAGILRARGVVFDHPGPLRAVDGVDLELRPGELLVVLGPNGSGKSTLLQLLGGLLEPGSGEVLLGEGPLAELAPRERARRIAVVPQFLPTLQDVRVDQFVQGGRYAHRTLWGGDDEADRTAVVEALAEADAAELGERLLTELSGGQRQRVLIARALAQEADLLLFDEPTASLDPDHQVMVFELIRELVGRGRAAVVVTHELPLASRYGSRLVLLEGGRVVAGGTAEEVLTRAVLEPVYGAHLHYGRVDTDSGAEGGGSHPLVVPWPRGPR